MWIYFIASLSLLLTAVTAQSYNNTVFANATIFTPPSYYTIPRTLYARTLLLEKANETGNVILATWENYSPEPPYFPIYQSTDLGRTWSEIGTVNDTVNGWGLRYQPFLYELPVDFGGHSAGTILVAGSSIPADLSATQIELYASTDKGRTWSFVSHIASGGRAYPNNGETPVWEPFLMMWQNQLICYYSDQRDPLHGQKLVHQATSDLRTWGEIVNDVRYNNYTFRPGMPVISKIPNEQYIMTYEFYGAPEGAFAVYYRLSDDPTQFDDKPGQVLRASDGTAPTGSPYNVWTPAGGENGTIVVSAGSDSAIFINHALAAADAWVRIDTAEGISYTRSLLVMPDPEDVLIVGGGVLNGSANSVTATEVDITAS